MTDHPLTDEVCKQIAPLAHPIDIRAAADWQLERVLKFMEENGFGIRKILLLKDAMRPQEDK